MTIPLTPKPAILGQQQCGSPSVEPKPNTRAAVDFLLTRPGFPVLSFAQIDPETGKKGLFETCSFPTRKPEAMSEWIESRQGRGNIYYSINPALAPQNKKLERENIASLVSLHVDLDPHVGEDQDKAQARIIDKLVKLKQPPTWIIVSGGGVQGIWDLVEPVPIGGSPEVYEDLKMYNVQIERELGGDHCHNIDRIMRLPGTINCPDERKLKKGRKRALAYVAKHNVTNYTLADFVKAAPLQETGGKQGAPGQGSGNDIAIKIPTNVDRVTNLAEHEHTKKLKGWVHTVINHGKDPDGFKVFNSRSEALFAVVNECVREEIPDEVIVAVITDPFYKISESILEKKNVDREVKRVLSRAHEFAIDPDLAGLNERYCVVNMEGKTVVMGWTESEINEGELVPYFQSFDDFKRFHNKYRKEEYIKHDNGDNKLKITPLGEWWLNHRYRRQYEGIIYAPYSNDEIVHGKLNLWTGFTVPAIRGDKHLGFLEHIRENLCNGHEDYFNYLICWMAQRVQQRGAPAGVAIVLKSESEGTGKGFFAKQFGSLFGKHFKHITNADHLVGKFNAHLQDCSFLFADEAFYAGDKKHGGLLKTIITEETMMIERKGIDAAQRRNFLGMVMASNMRFVIPAGQDARRYFVLEVSTKRLQDTKYFGAIAADLDASGLSNLLYFLQNINLSDFNIRNVPKTAALEEQKSMTRSGIDAMIEHFAQEGQLPWAHSRRPNIVVTTGERNDEGFWPWVRSNYRELTTPTMQSMTGILKREWGCKNWRANGDNGLEFPSLAELRRLFDKKHGPQQWTDVSEWQHKAGKVGTVVTQYPMPDHIPF
jgi:hypothetical protein